MTIILVTISLHQIVDIIFCFKRVVVLANSSKYIIYFTGIQNTY